MSEIVNMEKRSIATESDIKLTELSEELLLDARNAAVPSNVSYKLPMAELFALGTGVSSLIPAFNSVTQSTTTGVQGLYRIANSGAGDVLKKAKNGDFWGAMKKADGGSKMARLQEVDPKKMTPTVAELNPAVIMMAVALFSVEQKLGKIEEMEKSILSFLEIEKEAEIEADVVTLNDIIKKYKHSWDNEHFVSSNHKMVCDIQRTARKNIISFQKSVSDVIKDKKFIVSGVNVNSTLKNLYKKFKYYRLSLYTYSLASFLEIMLGGDFKEEYISAAIEEVNNYSEEYRTFFTECSIFLESLSKKSLETNVMKGIGTASNAIGKVIGSIPKVKDGQLDEILQEKGEKIKQSAEDVSKDVIGSFAEVSDPNTGLFIEKMNDMVSIYNKTTEICFDKDNIYLIA